MLEYDGLEARLAAGDVLVATREGGDGGDGDEGQDTARVLGALVLEPRERGAHVAAVAVRRRLRDRGVGTALVERAAEREGRLSADFDERVRPFYDSLGFSVRAREDGRFRGVWTAE